ncbi:MAG: hypothetical protein ACRDT6_26535 [Micromonosporaceae bacterium]
MSITIFSNGCSIERPYDIYQTGTTQLAGNLENHPDIFEQVFDSQPNPG